MTTEQEQFWAGDFGDDYHRRCIGRIAANEVFFRKIIEPCSKGIDPSSIIEFGAGIGENLLAINRILPRSILVGVDVNLAACKSMAQHRVIEHVFCQSILGYQGLVAQMTMTKGVLIHIEPAHLPEAYAALYHNSSRWILICEYFDPYPTEISYRGNAGRLWKRDFAADILEAYKDLRLVDYGFTYHLDEYPQDNLHWFMMEKQW